MSSNRWCEDAVFCENYSNGYPHWNLFHRQPRRRSFFWNGILQSLPAFRLNLIASVHDGATTLFWLDNWLDGRALADIWPHSFSLAYDKEGSIREWIGRADALPFEVLPIIRRSINMINASVNRGEDKKSWRLTSNNAFTVKSFYHFLNDGGLRCRWSPIILKGSCPRKINLFNWLAWDNKILSLENLALRGCNLFQTSTCVMCHAGEELTNHLLT